MPTKTSEETLFMCTPDGQMLEIQDISETVIDNTEPKNEMRDISLKPDKNVEFTGTFKLGKHFRCRNRKRFVKLLMSKGISRNNAIIESHLVEFFGYSYQEIWTHFYFGGHSVLGYAISCNQRNMDAIQDAR